jgi:hypothetical protein
MTERVTFGRIADFLAINIGADTAARSCETIPGDIQSRKPEQAVPLVQKSRP